jgi:hypothetical protein
MFLHHTEPRRAVQKPPHPLSGGSGRYRFWALRQMCMIDRDGFCPLDILPGTKERGHSCPRLQPSSLQNRECSESPKKNHAGSLAHLMHTPFANGDKSVPPPQCSDSRFSSGSNRQSHQNSSCISDGAPKKRLVPVATDESERLVRAAPGQLRVIVMVFDYARLPRRHGAPLPPVISMARAGEHTGAV